MDVQEGEGKSREVPNGPKERNQSNLGSGLITYAQLDCSKRSEALRTKAGSTVSKALEEVLKQCSQLNSTERGN